MGNKEHYRKQNTYHPCPHIDFLRFARKEFEENVGNQAKRNPVTDIVSKRHKRNG